jgi:predicted acylesterase/phospholipase RssA
MKDVEELVFSGGHLDAAFQYLGAFKELEQNSVRFENVKRYLGSSSGGIFAFFLAMGLNIESIYKLMMIIPFSKYDKKIGKNLLYIFDDLGIYDTKMFEKTYGYLLEYAGYNKDITFSEFNKKTGKDLSLISYCINSKEIKLLNHVFTPNLTIAQGLCMTTAIPLIFKPVSYENRLYTDCCLVCNFPLEFVIHTDAFLGFNISSNTSYEEDIGFMRYLQILYSSVGYEIYTLKMNSDISNRICTFISDTTPRTNFTITGEQIDKNMEVGRSQVMQFIKELQKKNNGFLNSLKNIIR